MHKATPEEQKEYENEMKFRIPSASQLAFLATKCGHKATVTSAGLAVFEGIVLVNAPIQSVWDPVNNRAQNHELLAAVIAKGDCQLFYDDGDGSYFIYQYIPGEEHKRNLANRPKLHEAVIDAAVALWCDED